MIVFNNPGWFLLLFSFPALIWLRYFWRKRGGRVLFSFQIWKGKEFSPSRTRVKILNLTTTFISWVGSLFLIAALAGPEIVEQKDITLSRGIDIMIVLDQSPSMGALDFPSENRFDTAREMIRNFVRERRGDAVGLVTFGSDAVLRSPPTVDYEWLINRLDSLELRELGDDTAIGMGLAMASLHLVDSTADERIIILLTDGDDNAGEIHPETAARLAADHEIQIYSIGVGREGEVPIELKDSDTGVLTRGTIITRFDEDTLRILSSQTGGEYWRANSPDAMESIFRTVGSMESSERRVEIRVIPRPVHRAFIITGALMILVVYIIRRLMLGEIP